jgi:hypothetical protein
VPTIKLTKSAIDSLPVLLKDTVYWDAGLPGFGVKVTPRGKKVFIVLYRTGGGSSCDQSAPWRRLQVICATFSRRWPVRTRTSRMALKGAGICRAARMTAPNSRSFKARSRTRSGSGATRNIACNAVAARAVVKRPLSRTPLRRLIFHRFFEPFRRSSRQMASYWRGAS